MSKLFKNYSYNLAYQLFSIIVPLITAPYLTRTLGATERVYTAMLIQQQC